MKITIPMEIDTNALIKNIRTGLDPENKLRIIELLKYLDKPGVLAENEKPAETECKAKEPCWQCSACENIYVPLGQEPCVSCNEENGYRSFKRKKGKKDEQ